MAKIDELYRKADDLSAQMRAITDPVEAANPPRDLTADEMRRFDALGEEMNTVKKEIRNFTVGALGSRGIGADLVGQQRQLPTQETLDRQNAGLSVSRAGSTPLFINADTGQRAALARGEEFRSHEAVAGFRDPVAEQAVDQYGSLGNLVRALSTTGASAVVPSIWSAQLIDLARNRAAVMQAGASIVPMGAKTVNIGRLLSDPTPAFRAEAATITPSDPTFDNVTLTAKTMSCLVIGSLEWFQDADNADQLVKDAISKGMAQTLDLVALYGGITAGAGTINLPTPPNPRGVLAALNANLPGNVLGGAANGTTQAAATYYTEILDTIYKVRYANEEPTALIWSSKAARMYAGANDTTGQPLRLPGDVEGLPRLVTNAIPSYTQGTNTTATDLFVGDWSQLLVGQRLGVTIQVLTEKYADTGQIGIVAHWRGDVQPARNGAFAVFRAIKGA